MIDRIRRGVEAFRAWASDADWKTWLGHSIVCTAATLAGFAVAVALSLILVDVLAFIALPFAWALAGAFYGDREFGEAGDFRHYVQVRDYAGMFDSLMDFLVPLVLSGAALAGLMRLYWLVVV